MITLEDKIIMIINYFLKKIIKPDITINKIGDLTLADIKHFKSQGIKGVILDVDSTLRKYRKKIPKCNKEWIDILKEELNIIVVSNGFDKNIEYFFESKGIYYISLAHKPLRKSFEQACNKLSLKPEEMLVIGDDLFADIYGGNRNNMTTIRVKDVESDER